MAGTVDTHRGTDYKNAPPNLAVTGAITLTPDETVVEIQTTIGQSDFTVTMPPVALCAGKFFTITLTSLGDNEIVTVAAVDGRIALSETLDEDEDMLLLFSNGREWFQLYNNLS